MHRQSGITITNIPTMLAHTKCRQSQQTKNSIKEMKKI